MTIRMQDKNQKEIIEINAEDLLKMSYVIFQISEKKLFFLINSIFRILTAYFKQVLSILKIGAKNESSTTYHLGIIDVRTRLSMDKLRS